MIKSLRSRHIIVITFCLWHMFAVASYLLPRGMDGVLGDSFRKAGLTGARYVLILSQWQKWDIFAPDPLRRSARYRIDRNAGDRWETALLLDYDHLHPLLRAREIKILERIDSKEWKSLAAPYLRSMCERIENSAGSELQLVAVASVLPRELSQLKNLSDRRLETIEQILGSYRCKRSS